MERSYTGPFEGPSTIKPPALPEDTHSLRPSLGQLPGIPSPAQGANQAHAGHELPGLKVDHRALVLEQRGLGRKNLKIAGYAALVALVG